MRKRNVFFAALALTGALAAAALFPKTAQAKSSGAEAVIMDGVYIGSVDVGGMTEKEAKEALSAYADSLTDAVFTLVGADGSMEITAEEMGLSVDTGSCVEEALSVAQTGNLIRRFEETKDLESGKYVVELQLLIDKQATAQKIYANKDTLDVAAVDNGLSLENGVFTYVEGQKGVEVNVVESVYAIRDFLGSGWNGTDNEIALVTEAVDARGTVEELSHVKEVIGAYSTDFSSSSAGRAINVKNGCAKVDGTIVYPGEEFSVYEAVSPFTQENGYELAGSYENGTTVESFGGGICQVSTTLYNAALAAELEISMRYNHSMIVTYVDPSRDAAIAGTYKDLRIVNNYEYPIYIEGYCSNGIIYFNIYGEETRAENRTVTYKSEVLETIEPKTQFQTDADQSYGYYNVEQSAHTGYVARLWKIVTVDGEEESSEIINRSTYQESPKIIIVGTGGATEEQLAAIEAAIETGSESEVKAATQLVSEPDDGDGEDPDDGDGEDPDEDGGDDETGGDASGDGGDDTPDDGSGEADGGDASGDGGEDSPQDTPSDDGA